MARPLRIEVADGIYHVTSRGLERRAIFRDDWDYQKWLSLLEDVARRRDWRVFAWALMENHFHLFLRTPHADLSAGMHDLNSGYVTCFNRRHGRNGPLFEGRFKGIMVDRDYHYWELSRYIHLNPVRAGLAAKPERYPWSSCRFYFSDRGAPEYLAWQEVLGQYGRKMNAARREYKRFLMAGILSPPRSPLDEAVAATLLGSTRFVDRMKSWLRDRLPDRDVPAARELRSDVSIRDIVRAVCRSFGVEVELLEARRRHDNVARMAAVYLCRRLTRSSVEKIGSRFGGVEGSAVSHIVRQVTERISHDREFNARLSKIEIALGQNSNFKT